MLNVAGSECELSQIGFEVGEVFGNNGVENFQLDSLVIVDGDVSESDHVLHGPGTGGGDESAGCEDVEGVAAGLGDSEVPDRDPMHGKVDGCLACAQQVEDDGILDCEIRKAGWIAAEFLGDPGKAAADDFRFVDGDVVHGGYRAASTSRRSSFRRA